jgi:hypothetical protein
MNEQMFTLHVQFINSQFQCNEVQILETITFQTTNLTFQCSFDDDSGITSIATNLTAQFVTIEIIISNNATAGGLTIGLTGAGTSSDNNHIIVQALGFQEPFGINNQTLTQIPTIEIQLVKVVNATQSLQTSSIDEKYSGLYIPLFIYDQNQVFYSENSFNKYHTLSQTTLTIEITKSLYYVRNIQQPIARQSEILFHNLLFTIVCIEIFGLVFLVFKLIIQPVLRFLLEKLQQKTNRIHIVEDDDDEENETEMRKRIHAYLTRLEEKEKNNRPISNTTSSSIAVIPSQIDSPQTQLSQVEEPTDVMHFISIRRFRRRANGENGYTISRIKIGGLY